MQINLSSAIDKFGYVLGALACGAVVLAVVTVLELIMIVGIYYALP